MTFDQVMENLTDMERRIIEEEIERREEIAGDHNYQIGWETGYASAAEDYY